MATKGASKKIAKKPGIGLAQAILALRTERECLAFLRDLCTPTELRDIEERWMVAQILNKGELSYRDIQSQFGVSVTTVGRVARFLKDEPYQGYRLILDRLGA